MRLTQAQIAAIHALENDKGQIKPSQVVRAAKDKRSPLHSLFDWNQANAAGKWWLHTARLILGSVKIQVETQEFNYRASAYIVDTEVDGEGYRAVAKIKADPDSARESLIYTLEVSAGHLRRAMDLAAPLGLSKQIDRLIVQITGLQRAVNGKKAA